MLREYKVLKPFLLKSMKMLNVGDLWSVKGMASQFERMKLVNKYIEPNIVKVSKKKNVPESNEIKGRLETKVN